MVVKRIDWDTLESSPTRREYKRISIFEYHLRRFIQIWKIQNVRHKVGGDLTSYNNRIYGIKFPNHFARDVGEFDTYVLTWSIRLRESVYMPSSARFTASWSGIYQSRSRERRIRGRRIGCQICVWELLLSLGGRQHERRRGGLGFVIFGLAECFCLRHWRCPRPGCVLFTILSFTVFSCDDKMPI